MKPFKKNFQTFKKKKEHNTNEDIRHFQVRIVGDNVESRIVSSNEALQIARSMDLDLVEISPNASPPVCRICDYSKFLYERKKKEKENRKNQEQGEIKEMQLTPNTGEHDVSYKIKNAIEWLNDGHKVKCVVFFKGRMIIYKDKGELLLLKIAQTLEEHSKVEQMPKMEGNKMSMIMVPRKKK